jgi:hypothetical protein
MGFADAYGEAIGAIWAAGNVSWFTQGRAIARYG